MCGLHYCKICLAKFIYMLPCSYAYIKLSGSQVFYAYGLVFIMTGLHQKFICKQSDASLHQPTKTPNFPTEHAHSYKYFITKIDFYLSKGSKLLNKALEIDCRYYCIFFYRDNYQTLLYYRTQNLILRGRHERFPVSIPW